MPQSTQLDSTEMVLWQRGLKGVHQEKFRVAVLSECRGKRYGTVIMDAVEDFIRDRVDLFILAALIEKKGFYEKCGYRCIDNEIFVDEGAKQCWMTKRANPQSET
ncbi:hypothetical protein PC112_g17775 [Phytophthora cactorum]|nr:hypothetical protein PC112_g17775 [Phytophthora cactorum]